MFVVETVEPVILRGPPAVTDAEQMSPFVFKRRDGDGYHVLVRILPLPDSGEPITGSIWLGVSDADGLEFAMEPVPLIAPGPGPLDRFGCEDPTVVPTKDGWIVYYTGVDEGRDACLLQAEGPDIHALRKCGVAHAASETERHTKEATVECLADDGWRLFFEYSKDKRSRVGVARCGGPNGPWTEQPDPLLARPGAWDSWHLSPGPLLRNGGPSGRHLMFYNGADCYPRWNIGWVVIDDQSLTEVARCNAPLIVADDGAGDGAGKIAFAASLIETSGKIWLYFTRDDKSLFRATIARSKS